MHCSTSKQTLESKDASERHSKTHQIVEGMALVLVLTRILLKLPLVEWQGNIAHAHIAPRSEAAMASSSTPSISGNVFCLDRINSEPNCGSQSPSSPVCDSPKWKCAYWCHVLMLVISFLVRIWSPPLWNAFDKIRNARVIGPKIVCYLRSQCRDA